MDFLFRDGKFLGEEWTWWEAVGWAANAVFSSRFFVQWYSTEKKKQVVVPVAFWWLSLVGSLLFLIYSLHKKSSVFIFAYAFTWLPYLRNLVIHRRHQDQHQQCSACKTLCPPAANFCANCGAPVKRENETASAAK